MESVFDPVHQHNDIKSKIVIGLERVSEVFRVLLWEHSKVIGLSPIQIQILIFINHHREELCNVSHLAKEFNLTKPTISDAIRILNQKKLIDKHISPTDKRAYSISLTSEGKEIVDQTESFANPIKNLLGKLDNNELENLFGSLGKLIYELNRKGLLTVQRTCYGCKFYEKKQKGHYCHFMQKALLNKEIRLDCSEYQALSIIQ